MYIVIVCVYIYNRIYIYIYNRIYNCILCVCIYIFIYSYFVYIYMFIFFIITFMFIFIFASSMFSYPYFYIYNFAIYMQFAIYCVQQCLDNRRSGWRENVFFFSSVFVYLSFVRIESLKEKKENRCTCERR